MHPRNRHAGHYHFDSLIKASPELKKFVFPNKHGDRSIDFANPDAVKSLNRALLRSFYGLQYWDIPKGYLCPPIPGRSDYIHHVADFLAQLNDGHVPRGESFHVMDIGVGASCIYPIIGVCEYGWNFVGTDIDPTALDSARKIVEQNPNLKTSIELRKQSSASAVFRGAVKPEERFDLVVCNPPFHASAEEAQAGSTRKWKGLGKEPKSRKSPVLNFGGQANELWCEGGELAFVEQMVEESADYGKQVFCFSTLVSKEANLKPIYKALEKAGADSGDTIPIAHGQKKSRVVCWTFLSAAQQTEWRTTRWKG